MSWIFSNLPLGTRPEAEQSIGCPYSVAFAEEKFCPPNGVRAARFFFHLLFFRLKME